MGIAAIGRMLVESEGQFESTGQMVSRMETAGDEDCWVSRFSGE